MLSLSRRMPATFVAPRYFRQAFSRRVSTEKAPLQNRYSTLGSKLDRLLINTGNASSNDRQEELMEITRELLKQNLPLYEEASIISRLQGVKSLKDTFWQEYLNKLERRVANIYKLRTKGDSSEPSCDEPSDSRDANMQTLLRISRTLIDQNMSSNVISELFARWIKNNGYYLLPRHISTFNGLLEYLVHTGYKGNLTAEDFDVIGEFIHEVKPADLVRTLYLLARLPIINEPVVKTVGRVLHNEIAQGRLSPFQKTKIARAYALMKHEHITFFKHIAEELQFIFEGRDAGKYMAVTHSTGEGYIEGIGHRDSRNPSGIICNVLPYLASESTIGLPEEREPAKVLFTGTNEQLYTDGQIIYILDSMMLLKLHHLELYFKRLLKSALKHCYVIPSVEQFDIEQLRSSISLLAQCRKTIDDQVLELICKRFIASYLEGNVSNAQLALFLKDLVKLTRKIVKTVSQRNRIHFKAKFVPPTWLTKPLEESEPIPGHRSQRSMIEALCTKICENVYSFDLAHLASVIRSIAYLGFRNESLYKAFIPYFKERVMSLNHVDIANITQALTKANVKDEHLFYLMSKQHQLYLHGIDSAHKMYVKRIG